MKKDSIGIRSLLARSSLADRSVSLLSGKFKKLISTSPFFVVLRRVDRDSNSFEFLTPALPYRPETNYGGYRIMKPFDCFRDGLGLNTLRIQNCLNEVSFLNSGFSPVSDRKETITGHFLGLLIKQCFTRFSKER